MKVRVVEQTKRDTDGNVWEDVYMNNTLVLDNSLCSTDKVSWLKDKKGIAILEKSVRATYLLYVIYGYIDPDTGAFDLDICNPDAYEYSLFNITGHTYAKYLAFCDEFMAIMEDQGRVIEYEI